ncbi:MAG TPA: phytoene desaturase family protein [Mycobacteriales bacterium]|nr:phytoene desaturase family protein [Mycobacteriales bacterium]
MSRVVVVGAGLGGLAAAARLAAQGHDVTVVEQGAGLGGKLGTQMLRTDAGDVTFDTGPSLLTMPHVLEELFADTGAPLDSVLALVRTTLPRARFTDGTVMDAATTAEDFSATLDRDQRVQWAALMQRAARVWDVTHGPFLEAPLDGMRTLLRLALRTPRAVPLVAPTRSLRDVGRRHVRDPHLRTLVDRYATYSGSDPRTAPAALVTVPWVEQTYGAWHVRGGLHRIAQAVADRARERGAVIETGCEVLAIERDGARVSGVRLADGARIAADIVVANADATHVYRDLVEAPGALRRLRRAHLSYSGFVLLLAVRGAIGATAHEVLFPDDYDAELDALAAGHPVADPTVYFSAPDDEQMRTGDAHAAFVLVNAPRDGQTDWDADGLASAYADRVLDLMAARGIDLRDRIVAREVISPAELARRTRAPGGAIYGTSSDGARAAFLRPANVSPVPGLFLVGGSSHPGGGLPLVLLSARIVAGLIG